MLLTKKIQIFPTVEQTHVLWSLSEKCCLIYNFGLQERKLHWNIQQVKPKAQRNYITYVNQQNNLPSIKRSFPEYKWVYSKVLQMTLKKLDANFKSFFIKRRNGDNSAKPPRFRGKQFFFTLCYNQSGYKFQDKTIKFSHKHPSRTPLTFAITMDLTKISNLTKQIEISFKESIQKWFIFITYEFYNPKYQDNGLYLAIDLGISNLVSVVNLHMKFTQIKNRRADKFWRKKIEEIQSKRDRCKKQSHRWHNYNKKFLCMKRKCANQMRDFQHKISKKIVSNTKANTIIIGDLSPKQMSRKKKCTGKGRITKSNKTLNYSIQNTGSLGRFAEFLTYKAEKTGKRVIRIDESFTSQKCCLCSKIKKRKLSERTIICYCGNTLDRDLNAAMNIMERFLMKKNEFDFLSHKPSLTEESFHMKLDLLRHTAPLLPSAVMVDS